MITIEERTDVTVVRLSRPPVNAFDLPMIEELRLTFERLEARPSQLGIVLTGTGQTFSAGVDTKAYAAYEPVQRRAPAACGHDLDRCHSRIVPPSGRCSKRARARGRVYADAML